jgi:integrase
MSLRAARKAKEAARELLDQGLDPARERKLAKVRTKIAAGHTFEAVANEWFEARRAGWVDNYSDRLRARLDADLIPTFVAHSRRTHEDATRPSCAALAAGRAHPERHQGDVRQVGAAVPRVHAQQRDLRNTMIYALYRMGYHGRATVHGLRSTASTLLNEREFNRDWIEMQLAHCEGDVRSVYNAAEWLSGRREMMLWWSDHLERIARPAASAAGLASSTDMAA